MYSHFLIPLDGSLLAETVIPAAVHLAAMVGARVTLLHVIERDAPREVHGERHLNEADEARTYLQQLALRRFPPAVARESHVHDPGVDDVARAIAEHGVELGADLIVMCTHGRSGIRAWFSGRVAQRVAAMGSTSVLLLPPAKPGIAFPFSHRRLLVPLDGNPEHEQAMIAAIGLAKACEAALHLLMVVPTHADLSGEQSATARMLPRTTAALLDIAREEGEAYLARHVSLVESCGIHVTAQVLRGDPVPVIRETARESGADLVVLGTHGRIGMDGFWSGSATPIVVNRVQLPLLLVPVAQITPRTSEKR